MRKELSILLLVLFFIQVSYQEHQYKYISYENILNKFNKLQQENPNFVKVRELREEAQLDNLPETNCGQNTCQHIYAEITNFQNKNYKKLPQVFLVGGFHGDEALGPNILTYLLEFIFDNQDDFIDMLNEKMLVVLPMANPSGYYANRREEQYFKGHSIDMNRDFPYNNQADSCFKTAGARVINYLFKKYLFQIGVTFHGGMYAIGYPWGSLNHRLDKKNNSYAPGNGELSPDDTALSTIGQYIKKQSPGNSDLKIDEYPVDTLTNGIYAVPGTLEDWAYAASWEVEKTQNESLLARCEGISDEELNLPANSVKSLFYLIEASSPKKPAENLLGTYEATLKKGDKQFGHIPRNIMASLALIESVAPSVQVNIENQGDYAVKISWKVMGCSVVDNTNIYWQIQDGNQSENIQDLYTYDLLEKSGVNKIESQNGQGNMANEDFWFSETLNFDQTTKIQIAIVASCDSNYQNQNKPVPDVGPQSHMVRARLENDYFVQNDQGFSIQSTKNVVKNNIPAFSVSQKQETITTRPQKPDITKSSINVGTAILIGLFVFIVLGVAGLLVKKFVLNSDESQEFEQMDQKLTKNNQRRKLQIDMGVSNTEIQNNSNDEKEEIGDDENQNTKGNYSSNRITHVIE